MALPEKSTRYIHKPQAYIENFFTIRTKEKKIVPFKLNRIQKNYLKNRSFISCPGKGQRDIMNKARQHGSTTFKMAEYLHDTFTSLGTTTVIVGHDEQAMQFLLENARLMHRSIPKGLRPTAKYDSKFEMYFPGISGRIWISTYRQLKLRSQTINNLLVTEVAFWEGNVQEKVAGMTESVPFSGNICFESTPNGQGGFFWDLCMQAKNGESIYKYFEYPWFISNEYRIPRNMWHLLPEKIRPIGSDMKNDMNEERLLMYNPFIDEEKIIWRRYKMLSFGDMYVDDYGVRRSRLFSQEYECDFLQSGNAVFDSIYIVPKTNWTEPVDGHRYIHGADCAEGIERADYHALQTLDLDTGEDVAGFRGRWKPSEFSERIHRHCNKYGGLCGIEANSVGVAVIQKVEELWERDYGRLWRSEPDKVKYWLYGDGRRLGWYTSGGNRPVMFIDGEEALRKEDIKLSYENQALIDELKSCQYNRKGKAEAPSGMNDDTIMALLIAYKMKLHYSRFLKKHNIGSVRARVYGS